MMQQVWKYPKRTRFAFRGNVHKEQLHRLCTPNLRGNLRVQQVSERIEVTLLKA